jgi:membrane dipeptidase
MLRRSIIPLLLLLLLGALAYFFGFGARAFDRSVNRIEPQGPLPAVSEEAAKLHASLLVIDLHADPLLWRRDLRDRLDHGHVDLPRLLAGNVGLQVFGSVTKTPRGLNYDANPSDSDMLTFLAAANLQPVRTWFSLKERALYHAEKLAQLEVDSGGGVRVIHTRSDLNRLVADRAKGRAVIGGMLGLEGAQALEGDADNLPELFDAGFRMLGLAHFFDNEVAGSMHGEDKYGLTDLGKAVVPAAESLGMIIDIAHSSAATIDDVFALATGPVVVSHGGVRAVCENNRTLTDDQLRALAATGGVIGIGYWDGAVCERSIASIVASMNHVRDLVGIEHVALGSDFDGAVVEPFDTSQLAVLTQALLDAGYTRNEIAGVMGRNAQRVFLETLPE